MKTKEEIEQLAEKEYREYPNNPIDKEDWYYNKDNNCHRKRKAFVKGYSQCQQDMAELYSKIENLIVIWSNDGTKTAGTLTRQIMKLLNKDNEK